MGFIGRGERQNRRDRIERTREGLRTSSLLNPTQIIVPTFRERKDEAIERIACAVDNMRPGEVIRIECHDHLKQDDGKLYTMTFEITKEEE